MLSRFGCATPKGRQSSPNPNPNPSMRVLVGFMVQEPFGMAVRQSPNRAVGYRTIRRTDLKEGELATHNTRACLSTSLVGITQPFHDLIVSLPRQATPRMDECVLRADSRKNGTPRTCLDTPLRYRPLECTY